VRYKGQNKHTRGQESGSIPLEEDTIAIDENEKAQSRASSNSSKAETDYGIYWTSDQCLELTFQHLDGGCKRKCSTSPIRRKKLLTETSKGEVDGEPSEKGRYC